MPLGSVLCPTCHTAFDVTQVQGAQSEGGKPLNMREIAQSIARAQQDVIMLRYEQAVDACIAKIPEHVRRCRIQYLGAMLLMFLPVLIITLMQ